MSVVLLEGFDEYDNITGVTKGNVVGFASTAYSSYNLLGGYRGGNALKVLGAGHRSGFYTKTPFVLNSGIVGCWFNLTTQSAGDVIVLQVSPSYNSDYSDSITVWMDATNRLFIEPTASSAQSNRSPSVLLNTWNHLELKYQRLNTTTIKQQLRINGAVVCECPIGIDAIYSIADTNYIGFGSIGGNYSVIGIFDHLYVLSLTGSYNNGFIGPYTYIQTLVPTGNGSSNQWSKSPPTGDAWDLVDDYIDGTGTYLYSSTSGNKELYNLPTLTGNVSSIKAVGNFVAGTKYGLLDMSIKHLADNNSVMATSGLTTVGFSVHSAILETNPATNLPWTTGELDSTQFGFELHYTGA